MPGAARPKVQYIGVIYVLVYIFIVTKPFGVAEKELAVSDF